MTMFTPQEKKNLTKLLACAVNQDKVLSLDGLHGLLFGLAIIPEQIVPSEWLFKVFGPEMFEVGDGKEKDYLLNSLFSALHRFTQQNTDGILSFPFGDHIQYKDLQSIREWVYGFFLAISLRPKVWGMDYLVEAMNEAPQGHTLEMAKCTAVLLGIICPEKIPELLPPSTESDSIVEVNLAKSLAELYKLVPKVVYTLQYYANAARDRSKIQPIGIPAGPIAPRSVEKVGRNDPCTCGSGAKYKKCCGK